MQENLPPFFKEYMEQKFTELHAKIDSFSKDHHDEIERVKDDVNGVKQDIKWLNQKVWMAMGALTIISIVGGIFAAYFKQLNKAQISEVVSEEFKNYQGNVNVYGD